MELNLTTTDMTVTYWKDNGETNTFTVDFVELGDAVESLAADKGITVALATQQWLLSLQHDISLGQCLQIYLGARAAWDELKKNMPGAWQSLLDLAPAPQPSTEELSAFWKSRLKESTPKTNSDTEQPADTSTQNDDVNSSSPQVATSS